MKIEINEKVLLVLGIFVIMILLSKFIMNYSIRSAEINVIKAQSTQALKQTTKRRKK